MSSFRFSCLVLLGVVQVSFAQHHPPIEIQKIDIQFQNAPIYATTGSTQQISSADRWVVMEVEIDTRPEWVDEATFEVFVLLKGRDGYYSLQGKSTYQHIEKGRGHLISMYISPQSFKRFVGVGNAQAIEDVIIRVTYENTVPDTFSKATGRRFAARRWWESLPPQPSVLRPFNETPWFPAFVGKYEQLKPPQ